MLVTITSGAHWRNTGPEVQEATQFAHIFDPESPEDIQHQVQNFLAYAWALGLRGESLVVLRPEDEDPEWVARHTEPASRYYDPEDEHLEVMLAEFCQLATGASGMRTEIR